MPQLQTLLGEISEKQGRFVDAAQHLQLAVKLDPVSLTFIFWVSNF